jgi:GxxExxY protein
LAFAVIGAAIEVHGLLGPGFLGSVYQQALAHELHLRSVPFDEQVRPPVTYKGQPVGYYVADFVVEQKFILEIKCISKLNSSHQRRPCTISPPPASDWRCC